MSRTRRSFIIVLSLLTVISTVGLFAPPARAGIGSPEPGSTQPQDPGRYLPPTGPIHWTLSDAEAVEGGPTDPGVLSFVLTASHAPTENLAFWASAKSGFATAGTDFVGFEDMLVVFPAGQTSITIDVQIIGDVFIEDDEVMKLYVWRPTGTGGYIALLSYGTIVDDDDLWYDLPPIEIPTAGPRWF